MLAYRKLLFDPGARLDHALRERVLTDGRKVSPTRGGGGGLWKPLSHPTCQSETSCLIKNDFNT